MLLLPCTYLWLPWCPSGKEPTGQCKGCRFDPWVRKIPWWRRCRPNLVFWPEKSHGAWQAIIHVVTRVGHDLVTKQQHIISVDKPHYLSLSLYMILYLLNKLRGEEYSYIFVVCHINLSIVNILKFLCYRAQDTLIYICFNALAVYIS